MPTLHDRIQGRIKARITSRREVREAATESAPLLFAGSRAKDPIFGGGPGPTPNQVLGRLTEAEKIEAIGRGEFIPERTAPTEIRAPGPIGNLIDQAARAGARQVRKLPGGDTAVKLAKPIVGFPLDMAKQIANDAVNAMAPVEGERAHTSWNPFQVAMGADLPVRPTTRGEKMRGSAMTAVNLAFPGLSKGIAGEAAGLGLGKVASATVGTGGVMAGIGATEGGVAGYQGGTDPLTRAQGAISGALSGGAQGFLSGVALHGGMAAAGAIGGNTARLAARGARGTAGLLEDYTARGKFADNRAMRGIFEGLDQDLATGQPAPKVAPYGVGGYRADRMMRPEELQRYSMPAAVSSAADIPRDVSISPRTEPSSGVQEPLTQPSGRAFPSPLSTTRTILPPEIRAGGSITSGNVLRGIEAPETSVTPTSNITPFDPAVRPIASPLTRETYQKILDTPEEKGGAQGFVDRLAAKLEYGPVKQRTAAWDEDFQPTDDLDEIIQRLHNIHPKFDHDLRRAVEGIEGASVYGTRHKLYDPRTGEPGNQAFTEKGHKRLQDKVNKEGRGVRAQGDILGGRILVDDQAGALEALTNLEKEGYTVSHSDFFFNEGEKRGGYRAIHTQLIAPSGESIELQLMTPEMEKAKEHPLGQGIYEKLREPGVVPDRGTYQHLRELSKYHYELADEAYRARMAAHPTEKLGDSEVKGAVGRKDVLYIQNHELPFRYRVVEASDVSASNDPRNSFERRKDYPAEIQGRVYHGDAGKGARERVVQMASEIKSEKMTHPSRSVSGPPIVSKKGKVVAGNQRYMAQEIAHSTGGIRSGELRASARRDAKMLGINPKEIDSMTAPIVVRELTHVDPNDHALLAKLNQLSDIPGGKVKNPLVQAAGRSRQLIQHPEILDQFSSTIKPDESINDYLRTSNGPEFLNALVKAEIITPAELDNFRDARSGKISGFGRERIGELFPLLALGGEPAIIDQAPAAILGKLEQSWVPAVKAGGLEPVLKEAIELHTQRVDNGMKSIADLVGQGDMFGGSAEESQGVVLARFLESHKKADVTEAFRKYAAAIESSKRAGETGDIFGQAPETQAEAFDRAFTERPRTGVGARSGRIGDSDPAHTARVISSLAGTGVGGAAGGAIGGQFGDTPEERRRNAALGMGLGAAIGGGLPFAGETVGQQAARFARASRRAAGAPVKLFDSLTDFAHDAPEAADVFKIRATKDHVNLEVRGKPSIAQLNELLTHVRENPDARLRYSFRDRAGRQVSGGSRIETLWADLPYGESNAPLSSDMYRPGARVAAVGTQPAQLNTRGLDRIRRIQEAMKLPDLAPDAKIRLEQRLADTYTQEEFQKGGKVAVLSKAYDQAKGNAVVRLTSPDGPLTLIVSEIKGGKAHVEYLGFSDSIDEAGNIHVRPSDENRLGASTIRQVMREASRQFPEIRDVSSIRVGGIRGKEANSSSVITNFRVGRERGRAGAIGDQPKGVEISESQHLDHHSGQDDYQVVARGEKGQVLGVLEYTLFRDELFPGMVAVKEPFRRKGIANLLYEKMRAAHPESELSKQGYRTEEGAAFRKKYDSFHGLDKPGKVSSDDEFQALEEVHDRRARTGAIGSQPEAAGLEKIVARHEQQGVEIYASQPKATPGVLVLDKIRTEKTLRGEGLGTKALQDLTRHADENGLTMALDVAREGNKLKLERWYKENGFVRNKGRRPEISEGWIREPKVLRNRTGAIGTQPDMFGHAEPEPAQGGLFGDDAGQAGAPKPGKPFAAVQEEARANAEFLRKQFNRMPEGPARKKVAVMLADLDRVAGFDKAITKPELAARAAAESDLFGNRAGAIGTQPEGVKFSHLQENEGRSTAYIDTPKGRVYIDISGLDGKSPKIENMGLVDKDGGHRDGFTSDENALGPAVMRQTFRVLRESIPELDGATVRSERVGGVRGKAFDRGDIGSKGLRKSWRFGEGRGRTGAIGTQPDRGAYLGETDLLNVSKIVESSTARERIAEAAEKYRTTRDGNKQTWAESDPLVKAAVAEIMAHDPKARLPHVQRKLTGIQLLARRDVIRQNDELIGTLSKKIAGRLTVEEREHASQLLLKAVEHNDALLSDLIVGSSQKGRDLNLLKRIANKSLDHDVWQIQAKRMLGADKPLDDATAAQLRKLVNEAKAACE